MFPLPIRAAPIKEVFSRSDNIRNISKFSKQTSVTEVARSWHITRVSKSQYGNMEQNAKIRVGSFQKRGLSIPFLIIFDLERMFCYLCWHYI